MERVHVRCAATARESSARCPREKFRPLGAGRCRAEILSKVHSATLASAGPSRRALSSPPISPRAKVRRPDRHRVPGLRAGARCSPALLAILRAHSPFSCWTSSHSRGSAARGRTLIAEWSRSRDGAGRGGGGRGGGRRAEGGRRSDAASSAAQRIAAQRAPDSSLKSSCGLTRVAEGGPRTAWTWKHWLRLGYSLICSTSDTSST
ncbi:uncharacterized protein LOC114910714 [Scleropages formosus]|uniref:uncharacterized protein LOC114909827 n=1 Tax=Scleropages formosus TaxID=113540 RepID=UPI0010FAB13E|nr:uncharacterized protein LOC114909827 [Scleropages formosus]XP_029108729.1 uncharacterized protein LOC114910714 [Scleropages formosus]